MRASDKKKKVERAVRTEATAIEELARQIHAWAEPAFKETQSAQTLAAYLEERGFAVEFPFPRIPTAFRASWGKGKPAIGMLGEYDALPNCGAAESTWGHGCGHHLLGAAPAAGAAPSRVLEEIGGKGRIVYYGCPAEETLAGKVYMARDGGFTESSTCSSRR